MARRDPASTAARKREDGLFAALRFAALLALLVGALAATAARGTNPDESAASQTELATAESPGPAAPKAMTARVEVVAPSATMPP